mgnify:CR=1 FL=1
MSGFDPETFDGESEERGLLDRIFPEREIILRTETRVRYLKVRPWFQKGVVVLVAGLVSWAGYSTYQFYRQDSIVLAKEIEIARADDRDTLAHLGLVQKHVDVGQHVIAVLPGDDPQCTVLAGRFRKKGGEVVTFGFS